MKGSEIIGALIEAIRFAADRHRHQRRKGLDASPYINHTIEVAEVLVRVGDVDDLEVLQAAILHDTLEDTETTPEELEASFGPTVRRLVEEVSDDTSLPKDQRKRLQVEHAPGLSPGAKQIKIADKSCNVHDVTHAPPESWSVERRQAYLGWTEKVVAGCRGCNPALERFYDERLAEACELIR
jgi:guanosine-3',5'-bis(diphosphate) 3'-pyrophosphohydrolase